MKVILKSLVVLSIFNLLYMAGCDTKTSAPEEKGLSCTIQFRRDALGIASPTAISPEAGDSRGSRLSIIGKLKTINDKWVVITRDERETWVPYHDVLLVSFHSQ